jgi:hypothetical protein
MAHYNYKELRDSLPPEMVDKWSEEDGSTDYDSTLWCYAADYIERLERERDEARQQEQIHHDNTLAMQKERDEAVLRREETVMQCELLAEDMRQWRECAEKLIDYARESLAQLAGWGSGYQRYEREMDTIRKDIAAFERLKEASK